jgi:hypothetical protein
MQRVILLQTSQTIKNDVFWDVTPCDSCKIILLDVSEEHIASIFRVKIISELGTRVTLGHIPEEVILHSHRRENRKSYKL